MELSVAFSVLLALAVLGGLHAPISATSPDSFVETAAEWTLVDQEPSDDQSSEDNPSYGSGTVPGANLDSDSEYQWIMRSNDDALHVASGAEIGELMEWIAGNKKQYKLGDILVSQAAPTQLEDGPTKLVDDSDKRPKPTPLAESQRPVVVGELLEEVDSTNFYPEYGVGILENGCTAFLVGPRHALTTASCVYNYNNNAWESSLDFWRGRNGEEYISKMYWDHVIIPAKFFVTGDHIHNWALISFNQNSTSPVWLKMAFSSKIHDIAMTVYGYLPDDHPWGTMYDAVCRSDPIQNNKNSIAVQCGTSQKFSGGPLLRGYNFQHSKMPLVYGISVANSYTYAHKAVAIHLDLFWSLCHLMKKDGFDARCATQE